MLPPARSTVPVVTDATAASNDILDEAILLFLNSSAGPFTFERCGGSVFQLIDRSIHKHDISFNARFPFPVVE
jgi:hypothetical protein